MKTKKTELDVDFIGDGGSLTAAEEKALSEFFSKRKSISKKSTIQKRKKLSNA